MSLLNGWMGIKEKDREKTLCPNTDSLQRRLSVCESTATFLGEQRQHPSGGSFILASLTVLITTSASSLGWGVHCEDLQVHDL